MIPRYDRGREGDDFLSFLLQEYFNNMKSMKYAIQDNISQMININKYGLVGI
jgi:hypothetical protein